ncbi:hypothetical protein GCM10023188_46960 [Pontibacter saemangeumensis]|uniref:Lipoprotein n=1 Tax=Pontibacter saemangeumensis TaxID=1084525 RepID=A0ABP8M839_9BACT
MKIPFLFILLLFLSSCGNQEESNELKVVTPEEVPAEQEEVSFERIIFSVEPGWSREKYGKDVEITQDSVLYFRIREKDSGTVVENYKAKLDSTSMERIYGLLDSTDFNSLKNNYNNAEDAGWISMRFVFYNGEVKMQGTLENDWKRVVKLLMLLEKQNLAKSENRHFSTTEDVLLYLAPFGVEELSDSLKRKLKLPLPTTPIK